MKTQTYLVEMFKSGEYETTKVAFIVDAIGRDTANAIAREAGNFSDLNANRKIQVSGKQAAKHIAEGATDLRSPAVATAENRKRLGALVGM